jgi:hypothetical protein
MSESNLSLAYADLMNAVALRNGDDPAGAGYTTLSAAKQARLDMAVQHGYRRFLVPPILPNEREVHRWSFLRPLGTLTTTAPYATGTIEIVAGALTTVTLTSGTWPSWAAEGDLVINGSTYAASARVGNTELTLAVNGPEVAAGTTYSLQRRYYTLSDDFGSILSPLTFEPELGYPPVKVVPESTVRAARSSWNSTGAPRQAAILPIMTLGATVGQRFKIVFNPCPDAAYLLTYRYTALVSKLDATNYKYPLGGMQHGETIKAACLAAAELIEEDRPGAWEMMFQQKLASSVSVDRENAPDFYDYNGEGLVPDNTVYINDRPLVTYNGQPTG